mmetsp:Transcript_14030/g.20689  ORF Transcript_14030/g.20689 Transcript_14030/m.20689 type:complete len:210 (+) Transcript_14030:494-1123(+)
MGSAPLRPTLRRFLPMSQTTARETVPSGTGTTTFNSLRVCVHTYLSVMPPLPGGGGSSSSVSSPSSAFFSSSSSPAAAGAASSSSVVGGGGGLSAEASGSSKVPSAPSSSTSSSFFTFPWGVSFSASRFNRSASAAFLFLMRSLRSCSLLASACFWALFSARVFSTSALCLRITRSTVSSGMAGSGAPVKKSVFRLRNEKTESSRGSIP